MLIFAELTSSDALTTETTTEECSSKALSRNYLLDHEPEFGRLYKLQQEVRNIEFSTLKCTKIIFFFNQGMKT